MGGCLSRRALPSPTLNPQAPAVSCPSPDCTGQDEGEENTNIVDELQPVPSSSGTMDEKEEIIITTIRSTDVSLGLRRLPAGFYTTVHHSGHEWRTENKGSSLNDDFVEWSGLIPIPSDTSATVRIEVYASFEFEPMLGAGEHLRELTTTVGQLLDHSANGVSFTFSPEDGDVVSPCSSIFVAIERRRHENEDPSVSRVLDAYSSTRRSRGELEEVTNYGHGALSLYRKHGIKRDLEHSVEQFERALNICPMDNPCRAAAQSNLAMARFTLCLVGHADASLEDPLQLFRNALDARPPGHLDRASTLIQLAAVHFAQSRKRRDNVEAAEAEKLLHEAIELSSIWSHENRAATWMLTLHGRAGAAQEVGSQSSVEQDSTSHGTDEGTESAGAQLLERFKQSGDLGDLQQAIEILEELVKSTSTGDERHLGELQSLGEALCLRFGRLGQLRDLQNSITRQREAVDLTPQGHLHRPCRLNNLATSLGTRFKRLGELGDLKDAISTLRDAIDIAPDGHHVKTTLLNNLSVCLWTRFHRLGELSDLEGAIMTLRNANDLIPHDHASKPLLLNHIGNFLKSRFDRLGRLSDIEEAILRQKEAVDLTPHGHPDKPRRLNNLGNSFGTRFLHLGKLSDLEEAISRQREAVNLAPHDHPDKPNLLNCLGISFSSRFERLGQLSDLEDAISTQKEAVDLTPHNHPARAGYLGSLGSSTHNRFERLGQLDDIEDAISTQKEAVDITPHGHPDRPDRLHNLGNAFRTRFSRLGKLSDIEDAISKHKEAIDLTPHDHPEKSRRLNNLGNSFKIRFYHLGQPSDLEDAISRYREGIELTPDGHLEKPCRINNLGNSFKTRFDRFGQLSDLEDAILRLREAVELTPHGHPHKSLHLTNLADSFQARFKRLSEPSNIEQAISLYSYAASSPVGPISDRFRASQKWISCATRIRHHSLLHAYSIAVSLLPQLAWIGLPLKDRYSELTRGADVVRDAAAAALEFGFTETAVEWLEQGRSIVWGELLRLRSSYDELSSAHPEHSRRLHELSTELDHASSTHEQSLFTPLAHGSAHHATGSSQQAADRHRRLAIERDDLLQEIRKLPGFEGFLRYKQFSSLRPAAHFGPVVILNAAEARCDALIVLADVDHPIHVPLPNFTFKRATDMQEMLKGIARDAREGKREAQDAIRWESFLSPLWKGVVEPVLDALAISTPGDMTRIFWCPTGPFAFLPIHAAGFYDMQFSEPGNKIFDFVVSSYVPTLSILAPSPNPVVEPTDDLQLLLVPQPSSDGQQRLPGVVTEVEHLKDVIRNSPSACTTILESSVGTVEEVLGLLKKASWVHFACHGIQDGVDSGLCLADARRPTLRDIIAVSRPRGGLAFLSACQTATGEKHLSEEAIHIAAGMLYAGYGGVIGTMWSISDRLAPDVAREVYVYLFRNGTRPDYRDAARALHDAICWVRESGRASFSEWMPFIHVGL